MDTDEHGFETLQMTPGIQRLARLIEPPPRYKISEWAEASAYLPSEGNAEPGKYRLARMPWQRDMLDDPLDNTVSEICWMLASQLGKTLCIILIVEFFIDHQPTKILVVYPKLDDVKDWMRDKFIPATRETPCLQGKLKEPRARDSESRALNRKFPGGGLVGVGSISTSSLRRVSARVVVQDEIDDFEITPQGDSMALADKRADTFHNAVKLKSSTPTHKDASRIEAKFLQSDMQRFFVPCPRCGHMQHLQWGQFKFTFTPAELAGGIKYEIGKGEIRDTSKAVYVCEKCQAGWSDQERIQAIYDARSEWRTTYRGDVVPKIRGRHLNGLYRVIGRKTAYQNYHHEFAEDFLSAKAGGRETMMVWINTFLAETFEDATEKLDWQLIKDRAEDYLPELPVEVLFIIAGVDVHPDRVEVAVYGWGPKQEVWALEYSVLYGDFDMPEMQARVEEFLLNRRYQHPVLGSLDIRAAGIDSGHQTKVKAVYHFSRKHFTRNIWAVKGFDDPLGSLYTSSKERRLGLTRFNLNVGHLKSYIYDRLKNTEAGANFIHFPKEEVTGVEDGVKFIHKTNFTARFYQQLCSERRFPERQKDGSLIYRWKKPTSSTRNEALDTAVYAFGVYEIVKMTGYIERKWVEVQGLLKTADRPAPGERERKDYVLKPRAAEKLPELKQVSSRPERRSRPRSGSGFVGKTKGWL